MELSCSQIMTYSAPARPGRGQLMPLCVVVQTVRGAQPQYVRLRRKDSTEVYQHHGKLP